MVRNCLRESRTLETACLSPFCVYEETDPDWVRAADELLGSMQRLSAQHPPHKAGPLDPAHSVWARARRVEALTEYGEMG